MSSKESHPTSPAGDLNLATHRASQNVWSRADRAARRQAAVPLVLGVAASLIAARAIGGHRWRGALLAGVGAGAAVWAAVNPDRVHALRQRVTSAISSWSVSVDPIGEASEDSFPASDAPSWTPTVGTGLRREPTTTH